MPTEVELKITLDAEAAGRLANSVVLGELRVEPGRTETLVSIYYDTPEEALAAAGIALRLRRVGRRWLQTIKRKAGPETGGLFSNHELEIPAPGGRLVRVGADPAFAAVDAAVGDAPLSPLFETRVKRRVELLRLPEGVVELAIDQGEVVAGDKVAPICEAELELKEGEVAALYALGRRLFREGPIRFAAQNKSARGYALARGTAAAKPKTPPLAFSGDVGVEMVARDIFRDCFAQIAGNLARVAEEEAPEGPHQLRVGLRRLRTGLKLFEPVLGTGAGADLSEAARRLGQSVSGLRDLDVLGEEVAALGSRGLDDAARDALLAALATRRDAERARVRAHLAGPEGTEFIFTLAEFIETRGWLVPTDYAQTARLARPIGALAPKMLDKRLRAARRRARGIENLDDEALHDLRKSLKTLRYGVEMFAPAYGGREVATYVRAIKDLQDQFGSLTDAAMAHHWLGGAEAVGAEDPAAQRAAGWQLGFMAARVAGDRPRLFSAWKDLADVKPFWRK
jgi:inorganic triphosphatase YgiF